MCFAYSLNVYDWMCSERVAVICIFVVIAIYLRISAEISHLRSHDLLPHPVEVNYLVEFIN